MSHNHNKNLTENKNDSSSEEKETENNHKFNTENNFKIFSLYKNLLKKEMPKYSNIETQIDTDKNLIKNYYEMVPIFRDSIEQNSIIYTFKNGFKKLFFGPDGFVTRKSMALRKFYKSFQPKKLNVHEKLYMGSMDLFDTLGNLSSFNKRLKNSQKKIILINGNFDLTNIRLMKMRRTYKKFSKKLMSKSENVKMKISDENNINSEKKSKKFQRFSLLNKHHNLFLDYKNNLIPDNSLKISLDKNNRRKTTEINFKNRETLDKISNINSTNNTQSKFFEFPNIKLIPKTSLFNKTYNNTNKNIKSKIFFKEVEKEENKKKKAIENYSSKPINFYEYFKQKNQLKKYVNTFQKSFNKQLYSSNNSNNKIRDSLNNFIIKNQKYVVKKNKYFNKKIQEPYNEFKEDSKHEENFQNFAKNVDFSNLNTISSKDKKNDKINTINMAYSFKVSLGSNVPVKEFIKKFKKKKEKEKENKLLKSVRKNFKINSKIIHNLTISLDDIKKKYNY